LQGKYINMTIKSMAIFCGSRSGTDEWFTQQANELGKWMAENKISLVYGGGNVGLMGTIANAALEHNGTVRGVIPKILDNRERSHKGLTELLVVEDMHTRKKKMYELCDAAIILPGGYGTLDELFEMITWNNLSIHDKQIYILNLNGFYHHLLEHIQTMWKHGFLYEDPMSRITVVNEVKEIFEILLLTKSND